MDRIALVTLLGKMVAEELGIAILTEILRENGYEVDVYHFRTEQEMEEILLKNEYKVICFNAYHVNIDSISKVSHMVKEMNNSHIVLGGHFATDNYEEILIRNVDVDYIIIGEAEETIVELMQYIVNDLGQIEDINGIAYRDGRIVKCTRPRMPIENLDTIPFACREIATKSRLNLVYIEGSRGCTGACAFCSNGKIPYREKSIRRIIDEIKYVIQKYNLNTFAFSDCSWDNPNNNLTRVTAFCNKLLQEKIHAHFFMFFKSPIVRIATDKFWNMLIDSGVFTVFIGIESFVETELHLFSKKATVEDNINIMEKLQEYKYLIHLQIGVIFFHPYSTIENMKINNFYLYKYKKAVQFQQLNNMEIYNNTKMFEITKNDGLYKGNGFNFSSYDFADKRVKNLYEYVRKEFSKVEKTKFLEEINNYFRNYYDFLLIQMRRHIWQNDVEKQKVVKNCLDDMFELMESVNEKSYIIFDKLLELVIGDWNPQKADQIIEENLDSKEMQKIIAQIRLNRMKYTRNIINKK